MDLNYFKRYRMEIDLAGCGMDGVGPPPGYRLTPWAETLLEEFAQTKFQCFKNELDSRVFPCLGSLKGCRRLMSDIARKPGFLPEATWLAAYAPPERRSIEYCGTIQGICDKSGLGAIQNVGVTAAHRRRGVGSWLLARSLEGFRRAGMKRVFLEVTAENENAVRLYEQLGFATVKTIFKAVEPATL
jgi:ribosomal protein S18 acetylase RimI-like enzyme